MKIDHPDIGIAGIKQGILYYRTLKDSDMPPAKTRTEEPYEEALKILKEQSIQEKHEDKGQKSLKSQET